MTSSFYAAARSPDVDGWTVSIDPTSAGWTYSSLRVATLAPGTSLTFATRESEWIVLPLAGSFVVTCGNKTFELEGRHSVFSRVSD
ncbi:MAG TPA: 5-deoxy-glucuronate isomerase, partial [Acidimicrobiales bacterium]|nr:5-deoxy-glucuronate isomerase [Acidimicrobiales bacterium]